MYLNEKSLSIRLNTVLEYVDLKHGLLNWIDKYALICPVLLLYSCISTVIEHGIRSWDWKRILVHRRLLTNWFIALDKSSKTVLSPEVILVDTTLSVQFSSWASPREIPTPAKKPKAKAPIHVLSLRICFMFFSKPAFSQADADFLTA